MGGACCCDDRELKINKKDSPTKVLRAQKTPSKTKETPTKSDNKTSKVGYSPPQKSAVVSVASPEAVRVHDLTLQDIPSSVNDSDYQ